MALLILVGPLAAGQTTTVRSGPDGIEVRTVTGGPESASPALGTAAISGIVVDATMGQPLANAVVALAAGANAAAGSRVLTDSRGRFLFGELPAGDQYTLSASKPGYFDGRFGAGVASSPRRIVLAAGQWFSEPRIALVRQGVISGRVLDEAGEPVVGAYVRSIAQALIAGRLHLISSEVARTDDRGTYRIGGLRPGKYFVSVPSVQHAVPASASNELLVSRGRGAPPREETALDSGDARLVIGRYPTPPASSGVPQAYPPTFYPGAQTLDAATALELGPGQERTADIQLMPARTWRVSGRIEGATTGATNLLLRLLVPGTEALGLGAEVATTVVDSQGRFTFLNVPSGRYLIESRRSTLEFRLSSASFQGSLPSTPGFSPAGGGGGTLVVGPAGATYSYQSASDDKESIWARAPIEVERDTADVVLPVRHAAVMTGRIVREGSSTPALGGFAQLTAEPADGSSRLGFPSGRIDTQAGTFRIPSLLPGRYMLRMVGGTVKSITWQEKDLTNTPFEVTGEQDLDGVVITLTSQTSAEVSGTVRQTAGSPARAAVIVFPVEQEQWVDYGFRPTRLAATFPSTANAYSVRIRPGDYYLLAVAADRLEGWHDPAFLAAASAVASRVTVNWDDKKTVDLVVRDIR